jgi:hypothetical protein
MHRAVVAGTAVAPLATIAGAQGSQDRLPAPVPYELTPVQAEQVRLTVEFVNAFNAHRLRPAVAVLAPNALGSDCDYRRVRAGRFFGKAQIAAWLRWRFADRDHLDVARIFNENPEGADQAVGLDYRRRTSHTLRALGFPHGIKPQLGSKVVFTLGRRPLRIARFANGPVGGSADLCRPR